MRYLIAIAILAVWGACANYATFQEADVLHKGTMKYGAGATYGTYKIDLGDDEPETLKVPAANVWIRRGLFDKLEAHASAWIPLGASAGVKYQLTGNREMTGLSFSVGLDLGFLQSRGENEAMESVEATLVDTYVPLYVGYRLHPAFAVYASPKYILRTYVGKDGTELGHLTGGTIGVAIGAQRIFYLEGTTMYDFDVKAPAFQGGIGVTL